MASLLSPTLPSPNPASRRTSFGLAPSSSSRNNPLTLRLYKLLGSSYADPATHDALVSVSEFYAAGEGAGGSAARARKTLRKDTEERLAESSRRFLGAFGEVNSKLQVLEEHVTDMHAQCDDAETQLRTAQIACKHLLDMSSSLLSQRQTTTTKSSLITIFLSRFTLTDEDSEALTSRDVPVGPRVFSALDHAARIRSECAVLLTGSEHGGTKAGTDIMSTISTLLEAGHEKLARWTSYELRALARESDPGPAEVAPVLREAVRRITPYPDLLDAALSTFTETRRSALLSSFLAALTLNLNATTTTTSRAPIELHAHDPSRYVADMLAWVHGSVAGEREFLEGLFGIRTSRWVGEARRRTGVGQGAGEEGDGEVERLVDEVLERVRAPLKVRVQQTIRSQESPIVTYKLYNLLQFYSLVIAQTVGEQAEIVALLREQVLPGLLTDDAYTIFFEALAAQGRSLLRFLHPPDPDLSPPPELRSASHVLREIIDVYTSALVPPPSPSPSPLPPTTKTRADDADEEEEEGGRDTRAFATVLHAALGPMEEMCRRVADLARTGWEGKVFGVNCLVYLQGVLGPFEVAQGEVERLDGRVGALVDELVEEHYAKVIKDSGLAPVLKAIETKDDSTPLSHLPAASPTSLSLSLTSFSHFLASPLLPPPLLPPHLSLLVQHRVLERLDEGYMRVCEEVRRAENRYEAGETLLGGRRPWGDGRVLRQILGLAGVEE